MADAYLQSLLADGEAIRSEARQHPMALLRFALQPILLFVAAFVCLGIGVWLTPDGQGLFNDIVGWIDTLLGLLTAGLFIVAIVWFPIQVFRWLQRRYLVTDRRVLYVDGVFRKNSSDAGLSMITDVSFRQGVLGRSLGYGDLVIATASNRPLHFRQIKDALEFKQAIMAAQHATVEARADEILVSRGLAPASAVSAAAAPVAAVAAAAVPAAPVEPPAPVEPAAPAWDGSDVPQMAEDDVPPSDPSIFGASAAVAAQTADIVAEANAPAEVAEVAEVAEAPAEVAEAEAPAEVAEAEAPADVAEAPAEVAEADVAEAPADVAEAPADVAEAPAEVAEADVAEAPADVAEAPADVAEPAADAVVEPTSAEDAGARDPGGRGKRSDRGRGRRDVDRDRRTRGHDGGRRRGHRRRGQRRWRGDRRRGGHRRRGQRRWRGDRRRRGRVRLG
ncbi:MAG: PH domain-containing protein [Chloroflexota bacterium]